MEAGILFISTLLLLTVTGADCRLENLKKTIDQVNNHPASLFDGFEGPNRNDLPYPESRTFIGHDENMHRMNCSRETEYGKAKRFEEPQKILNRQMKMLWQHYGHPKNIISVAVRLPLIANVTKRERQTVRFPTSGEGVVVTREIKLSEETVFEYKQANYRFERNGAQNFFIVAVLLTTVSGGTLYNSNPADDSEVPQERANPRTRPLPKQNRYIMKCTGDYTYEPFKIKPSVKSNDLQLTWTITKQPELPFTMNATLPLRGSLGKRAVDIRFEDDETVYMKLTYLFGRYRELHYLSQGCTFAVDRLDSSGNVTHPSYVTGTYLQKWLM